MSASHFAFRRPTVTRGVLFFLALCCIGWLAQVILEPLRAMAGLNLLVTSASMGSWRLWTIVSHAFFPVEFLDLALTGFMIYLFGSDAAQRHGDKRWLMYMAFATLLGGLFAAPAAWLLGGVAAGPHAALNACLALYCWPLWNRRLQLFTIELTGKTMFAVFLTIDFIFALLSMNPALLAVKVGGTLAGLMCATNTWGPAKMMRYVHYWRVKRNLKVVARAPEDKRRTRDGEWIN